MARRRKRGALRALDLPKRKGKGLAGIHMSGGLAKHGRKSRDLSSYLRADKKSLRLDRRSSMGAKIARVARDRLTPTERFQVDQAIRDAEQNDPVVSAATRDAQRVAPNQPNVIQRLAAFMRARLSFFRRNEA